MNIQNMRSQLLEHLHTGGTVIDESTTFGRGQYLTTQDEMVVIIGLILCEKRFQAETCNIKRGLHDTLALLVGKHLRVGPLSEQ